jgi:hypothetical protein
MPCTKVLVETKHLYRMFAREALVQSVLSWESYKIQLNLMRWMKLVQELMLCCVVLLLNRQQLLKVVQVLVCVPANMSVAFSCPHLDRSMN